MTPQQRHDPIHVEWWEQASDNVEKWGEQSLQSLFLAKIEEIGELAAAIDEHTDWRESNEGEFAKAIVEETAAIGTRTRGFLEQTNETQEGTPLAPHERPTYGVLTGGLDEVWDELGDDAALSLQIHWALIDHNGGGAGGD